MALLIKLDGKIKSDTAPILGTFTIHVTADNSNPSPTCNALTLNCSEDTKLTISGNGFFTDSTLVTNLGKTKNITKNTNTTVYFSKGNYDVICEARYSAKYISDSGAGGSLSTSNMSNVSFNLNDLAYAEGLSSLYMQYSNLKGDIASLSERTTMTAINLQNTKVTGDIKELSGLTSLASLNISNTDIEGNISNLAEMASLTALNLNYTKVEGDIASLSSVPLVGSLYVQGVDELYGDLSTLSNSVYFVSNANGNSEFSWETTRSSSAYFIGMEGINLGDSIDAMLDDQQELEFASGATQPWHKTIKVYGTRTSASDSAVAALKARNVTIIVNDVTL